MSKRCSKKKKSLKDGERLQNELSDNMSLQKHCFEMLQRPNYRCKAVRNI